MNPVTQHFQEVVAGVAETHRATRDSLIPEYNRGVHEGRSIFLTQLSDRVDEFEGDGDLSMVRRWVMNLRKEGSENKPRGEVREDQVMGEVEAKEDEPESNKRAVKEEAREEGQRDIGVLEESTSFHNTRKRHWENSEEESERCRKRICEL